MGAVALVGICVATALTAALSWAAARAGSLLSRILWIDALALVLVALMSLISISRSEADYLDVALILALLSFTGTLAAVRYHQDGHL